MIRKFILIFTIGFILANSAFAAIELDPSLVRPWSQKDKSQFPTPLAAAFKKEGVTFIFVGDHHSDPASTFKHVQAAFETYSPEIVVVEGLNYNKGENPQEHMSWYASKTKEEVWKDPSLGCGTELVAVSHNVPVIGGEPSIEEEMDSPFLRSQGFTAEDIRNVQILQRIPFRRDVLKMTDPDIFFQYVMKLYDVKEKLPVFKTAFLSWYKAKSLKTFDYMSITKSDAAVNCGAGDTFFQKVACAFNMNRDRALVEHVGSLLKNHHRILVVYGTGHFVQEYPVYLKAFGAPPEYLKLESK